MIADEVVEIKFKVFGGVGLDLRIVIGCDWLVSTGNDKGLSETTGIPISKWDNDSYISLYIEIV